MKMMLRMDDDEKIESLTYKFFPFLSFIHISSFLCFFAIHSSTHSFSSCGHFFVSHFGFLRVCEESRAKFYQINSILVVVASFSLVLSHTKSKPAKNDDPPSPPLYIVYFASDDSNNPHILIRYDIWCKRQPKMRARIKQKATHQFSLYIWLIN